MKLTPDEKGYLQHLVNSDAIALSKAMGQGVGGAAFEEMAKRMKISTAVAVKIQKS